MGSPTTTTTNNPWLHLIFREVLPNALLAGVLALGLYLIDRHHRLRKQVSSVQLRPSALSTAGLESLPQHLVDHLEEYKVLYYRDTIPISPASDRPADRNVSLHAGKDGGEEVFTKLMRRNMRTFSTSLPQARLLRFLAKTREQKISFTARHIDGCEFREGDLVCGVYRVLHRQPLKCELGMSSPKDASAMGLPSSFGGRLVTSVSQEDDRREILVTETAQWVLLSEAEEKRFKLPLERGLMRWMHELASWGLLVSGSKWLGEQFATADVREWKGAGEGERRLRGKVVGS